MMVSDKWLADHNKTTNVADSARRGAAASIRIQSLVLIQRFGNWHAPLFWTYVAEFNL